MDSRASTASFPTRSSQSRSFQSDMDTPSSKPTGVTTTSSTNAPRSVAQQQFQQQQQQERPMSASSYSPSVVSSSYQNPSTSRSSSTWTNSFSATARPRSNSQPQIDVEQFFGQIPPEFLPQDPTVVQHMRSMFSRSEGSNLNQLGQGQEPQFLRDGNASPFNSRASTSSGSRTTSTSGSSFPSNSNNTNIFESTSTFPQFQSHSQPQVQPQQQSRQVGSFDSTNVNGESTNFQVPAEIPTSGVAPFEMPGWGGDGDVVMEVYQSGTRRREYAQKTVKQDLGNMKVRKTVEIERSYPVPQFQMGNIDNNNSDMNRL